MKTRTILLTTLMFVLLLICSTGIQAQTAKSSLDQTKLMQQWLGTWEGTTGKDTIEVWECRQYGKSFIANISLNIRGKKSPYYIANICIDSKGGNFKSFILFANGEYSTWIGLWTTEKKFNIDLVKNFNPETVDFKVELVYETPTNMTFTSFNSDGTKTEETKYKKVK